MLTKPYIPRDIRDELHSAASEYPVVTILGPRQSGKTTLARMEFPGKPHRTLEDPDIRMAAEIDPRGFLNQFPDGAVFDEIQRAPQLLSYIQSIVDQNPRPGKYILTGSHQPLLHQAISQTLAGRTALLTLLPLSLAELKVSRTINGNDTSAIDTYDLMVKGSFPRLSTEGLKPDRFFNGYIATYLERDIRAIFNLKDLTRFQQFLTLLAGRVGQIVNYASLGNDVGISGTTLKQWISALKASYVVFELPPYFENIGKRLVKSPKIYFTDTGLVAYFLGIRSADQAKRDPLRGGLYENLIILEVLKCRLNRGMRPDLYFYRDAYGNEVDLVIKDGIRLTPIEIKSAETFTKDFLTGIERFKGVFGEDRCVGGKVFYNGDQQFNVNGINISNLLLHSGAL